VPWVAVERAAAGLPTQPRSDFRRLLPGLAGEAGFLQCGEHFLVVEIAVHGERFCTLGGGVAGNAVDFTQGGIHGFNAFAAAEMDVLHIQRFHLFTFRAGVGVELDGGIAALAEITGGYQSVGGLLHGGRVRSGQGDRAVILARGGGDALDTVHCFRDAFDTARAAEMDAGEFG